MVMEKVGTPVWHFDPTALRLCPQPLKDATTISVHCAGTSIHKLESFIEDSFQPTSNASSATHMARQ